MQVLCTRPIQCIRKGHPGRAANITILTGRSRPPSMVRRLTKVLIYNCTAWDLSRRTAQINLWWKGGMLWRHITSVSFTACSSMVRVCGHMWEKNQPICVRETWFESKSADRWIKLYCITSFGVCKKYISWLLFIAFYKMWQGRSLIHLFI